MLQEEEDTTVLLGSSWDDQTAEEDNIEHFGAELNGAAAEPSRSDGPPSPGSGGHTSALVLAASLVAATGGLLFGYDVGVISVAQLQLQKQLGLSCTAREAVVSCMMAGALLASMLGGIIIDSAGRKFTIIVNAILFVIGASMLAGASSLPVLLLGRLVVGFAVSLSAISECIYISEIAPAHRRGMLVSLNEMAITVGFLASFLAGFVYVDVENGWRYMFGMAVVPAVFQALGMLFLPRTPHFLLLKRQEDKAEKVLQRLTGQQDVRQRLAHIRLAVTEQRDARCSQICAAEHNMADRMFIGMGLVFFQQFTGQPNVMSYAPTILQMVGFCSDAAATMATVGLGVVKVVSTVCALLLVDRAGRRTFLLAGSLLMALCLLGLSVATSVQQVGLPEGAVCKPPGPVGAATEPPAVQASLTLEPLPTPLPLRAGPLDGAGWPGVTPAAGPVVTTPVTRVTTAGVTPTPTSASVIDATDVNSPPGASGGTTSPTITSTQPVTTPSPTATPTPTPTTLTPSNSSDAASNATWCGADPDQHPSLPYLAFASLMGYVAAYAFGFGPMTWLVLSEIYPPAIRGRAVAVATSLNWLSNMVISATFLQAVELLSVSGTFLGYALLCLISAFFVFFSVPETRGKSLHEISEELSKKSLDARARSQLRRLCRIKKHSRPAQHYDLVAAGSSSATSTALVVPS
ncbi:solute carrier family 2, facilitated glucose transporter member 10-like isoform X1 [Amphibalanus amphitrite]|nr:solute carrier family 2, facilitated glucose transporter member 10-like isoform X1 [Amphibalanus amphitrite]